MAVYMVMSFWTPPAQKRSRVRLARLGVKRHLVANVSQFCRNLKQIQLNGNVTQKSRSLKSEKGSLNMILSLLCLSVIIRDRNMLRLGL